MRKLFIALISISMAFAQVETLLADDNVIYIAEPVIKDDMETAKTLISIFKPDGTEIKKINIDSIMARVSPDGKNIVYLEQKKDNTWELVLADSKGKRYKNFPLHRFSPKNQEEFQRYIHTNIIWSPDGKKIAILQMPDIGIFGWNESGYPVRVSILYLTKNEIKVIHADLVKEKYGYSIQWFPDSTHMLFTESGGAKIVDTESKAIQEISIDSIVAHLTGDGKKIVHISGDPTKKPPFDIWLYDIKKQKSEKLLSLDIYPTISALSYDGRYLVFQSFPIKDASIFVADLFSKRIAQKDSKGFSLIPKKFSPLKNNLIICSALKEETIIYGIFNLTTGDFQRLKETSTKNIKGEMGWLWLMGFDWYDWR